MKKRTLLSCTILYSLLTLQLHAQKDRSTASTYGYDSLTFETFKMISSDSSQKHFQPVWPSVIRRMMTNNLDSNYDKVLALQKRYKELVPAGYEVYIFFNHADSSRSGETYDITIRRAGKGRKEVYTNRIDGMDPHNNKSARLIRASLGWEYRTIMEIRRLLKEAGCAGIENGGVTCIYYSKEYRYLFFPKDLTMAEQEKYDDQKRFFFYRKNIVIDMNKKVTESLPDRDPS